MVLPGLVMLGSLNLISRLREHPRQIGNIDSLRALLPTDHLGIVHVGLRDVVTLPEVGILFIVEARPVFVRFPSEQTITSWHLSVHSNSVDQLAPHVLVIGILGVVVARLRLIRLFLVLLADFVVWSTPSILARKRSRVRVDVCLRVINFLLKDEMSFGVPVCRLNLP